MGWRLQRRIVGQLASVTTEGCSVARVVIFAAVVVRDRKSGLAKWKEAGRNGKGGDGMQLCLCGTYSARHTTASVYREAARMAAEVSFLSEQAHVSYTFNIRTVAAHCMRMGAL